jgi:hypothetical protein
MKFWPHLWATVLTLGLWGIPWIALARRNGTRLWHCCVCGKHRRTLTLCAEMLVNNLESPVLGAGQYPNANAEATRS